MVPARIGSQRLPKKNLRLLNGLPLVTHALRKCKECDLFDEVWLNSESQLFQEIASSENVLFHHRPLELGQNYATSESYISEFLGHHFCDLIIQVHSIAPLLTKKDLLAFTNFFINSDLDCLFSCINEQIECSYKEKPINFNIYEKQNSQELEPIQKITWSITGWRRNAFLQAFQEGKCATYAGEIGYFPINRLAAHIIKTEEDLRIAEALYPLISETEMNAK